MKISDIMLNLDVPSNETKLRFKNNQIKLNGDVVTNVDLDINLNFIMEFGEFLCQFYNSKEIDKLNYRTALLGLKPNQLFGTNIPILEFNDFYCLTISKNEHYILMKDN